MLQSSEDAKKIIPEEIFEVERGFNLTKMKQFT
jgi:hypothetical protein